MDSLSIKSTLIIITPKNIFHSLLDLIALFYKHNNAAKAKGLRK
jgi:NADH:ubiquinone oxidoreductase subunit 6 (subunit J)